MLTQFRPGHEQVHMQVLAMETPRQLQALQQGEIDAGLLRPRRRYPEGVKAVIVHSEPFMVALAENHPLARHESISVADLRGQLAQHGKARFRALPDHGQAVALEARQHMQVKVKHRLPCRRAVGLEDVDAVGVEGLVHRRRHALGRLHHSAGFLGRQLQQIDGMALAGNQHMASRGLTDVHEGNGQIVLIDLGRWNLPFDELAENALARGGVVYKHGHDALLFYGSSVLS